MLYNSCFFEHIQKVVLCLTICPRQTEKRAENKVTDWIKTNVCELEDEG